MWFSLLMVSLLWYGLVVPAVAWKAPKLSLVLELGSAIMWGWCWWGFPLPPCLPFLHMRVLAAHPQCWPGLLSLVYDFMTPHTHGLLMLLSWGSGSACRLVLNGLWKPARFLVQHACLPTVHRIFYPSCHEYHQVSYIDHFPSWDWGVSVFCELHSFFNFFKKVHHWV